MTGELSALKPAGLLLLIGGLFLAGLLAVGWSGAARLIVPSADDTAGEMLHALLAHREPAAHRALTRQLQEQVPTERLEQLASEIAERLGAISHLETETVEEQDDRATVRATVRVGAGEERTLELPLVKEEGFWRVASLEPLGPWLRGRDGARGARRLGRAHARPADGGRPLLTEHDLERPSA